MFALAGLAQEAPPDQIGDGWSPSDMDNTAALGSFPFCVCEQYKCDQGPYRLQYVGRSETQNFVDMCFQINTVGTCCMIGCVLSRHCHAMVDVARAYHDFICLQPSPRCVTMSVACRNLVFNQHAMLQLCSRCHATCKMCAAKSCQQTLRKSSLKSVSAWELVLLCTCQLC